MLKQAVWVVALTAILMISTGCPPSPPRVSTFSINNGNSSTIERAVTLNNTCTGNPTHWMASEEPDFTGAVWTAYDTAPEFRLSPGGEAKTVYFKVKGSSGTSAPATATITLETSIIDLGFLGGDFSDALSLNNFGQVVGASSMLNGRNRPFIWDSENGIQDLGVLIATDFGTAVAINDVGQIIGYEMDIDDTQVIHPLFWDVGLGPEELVGLTDPPNAQPYAINNDGHIVGTSATATGSDGFVWDFINGIQSMTNTCGQNAVAYCINDRGQIAARDDNGAFLWDPISGITEIASGACTPTGISNNSPVTGYILDNGGVYRGFIWTGFEGMTNLGNLGSDVWPSSINLYNQIVGGATVDGIAIHAFIWDTINGMRDLNDLLPEDSGWTLFGAADINDNGDIVGRGYRETDGNYNHAYLLRNVAR